MKCLECNKEVKQLSYRHLKKCCNLLPKEYKKKHGVELFDEETKKKCSFPLEKNGRWKGGVSSIKYYCEKCGEERDKRSKSKLCAKCISHKGEKNGFFNRTHSEEAKRKMVEGAKKRDKSTYKAGYNDPKDISDRQKNHYAGLTKEQKYTRLENWIAAGQKACKKASKTKIENKIDRLLQDLNIQNYKRNYQIGAYNVDFLIDDKIIECFGDYWHCNPNIFEAKQYNRSIKRSAEDKWRIDDERKNKLISKGYKFLSLWEYDIYNNFEKIKEQIKHLIYD